MASQTFCYLKEEEGSFAIDEKNNGTVVDKNGVPLGAINVATIDFGNEYTPLDINGVMYVLHICRKGQDTQLEEENENFEWNSTTDLLYLDLYEQYKPLVGKRFRTKNKMFSQICADMRSAPYNYKINEDQVRNHDKTIRRRMKKYFQNTGPRSTGNQRKPILNEKKVLEVYGKQQHITTDYVLSREGESTQEYLLSLNAVKESIDIQNDRMKERSEMYKKLVEITENWAKENLRLQEEANLERKRKNDLLQERNDLFKQLLSKK